MTAILDQINNAIGAHGMWKMRLRTAITSGSAQLDSRTVGSDCNCDFGRWLHGPQIDAATRDGIPFQVVSRLHREFHQSAGRVVACVEQRRHDDAETLMAEDFTPRSDKLVRALNKWKRELMTTAFSRAA